MTSMNIITLEVLRRSNGRTLGTGRKASIAGEYPHTFGCHRVYVVPFQQEAQLDRKEQQMHNKATRAALHGNIGRAINLEVTACTIATG